MGKNPVPLVTLLLLVLPAGAPAVDGVSVTAHWSGSNQNLYGGYGEIVRHDIADSQVTAHTVLYPLQGEQAGRNPVINHAGSHVAFLRQDGRIVVLPIGGGDPVVLDSAQSHGEACLDWPQGDWIYYTRGGFSQPSGSKLLHKVHAFDDSDEYVLTFKKDDGVTDSGTWRFHIAADKLRAAVRPDDTNPHPAGCITAFHLTDDAHLRSDRSLGAVGDYRCSTGIDPEGVYFSEGNVAHTGVTIRAWNDLSSVKSFLWEDARWWGPDTSDTGISHNRNAWSTNSQKWLCIHVGFGNRGARGANQMLIDWVDEERIVVTENGDNSYEFDDAGDFWIDTGPSPPVITAHPEDLEVEEGQTAAFSVSASGSAPLEYQWLRDGSEIGGAEAAQYSFDTNAGDDGVRFSCRVDNAWGNATSDEALLTVLVDDVPPQIESASSVGDPESVSVVFSEALALPGAEDAANYAIDHGIAVSAASLGGDLVTVTLTTDTLSSGVTYTLTVNNVTDRAPTPNPIATDSTIQFEHTGGQVNEAPEVDAGPDANIRVNTDLLLEGSVSDDGLPGGELQIAWSKIDGPGNVTFTSPDQAQTFASFDAVGEYTLRLWADDGEKSSSDEVQVTVEAPPSITILEPAGGESWEAGSVQHIRWSATGVADVRIDYSADGGETFNQVELTIDTESPHWQDYPWTVPNDPTDNAVVQLTEYSLITSATSNTFTIVGSGQSLDLLSPAAGDELTGGQQARVTWSAENVASVVIEFSLDEGHSREPIATVRAGDADWGDVDWTVPNAHTDFAEVFIRTPGGGAADSSGAFSIRPATLEPGDLEVDGISLSVAVPLEAEGVEAIEVNGESVDVGPDGTFTVETVVAPGTESLVIELFAAAGGRDFRRLLRVDIADSAPPIEGLDVSRDELIDFLGGATGVLVWVDSGTRIRVLDFREAQPEVRLLSDDLDCVNPLVSPDGTRVVYSRGRPNGLKTIFVRPLAGGDATQVATGDVGYWQVTGGTEHIVYCDWSDKSENGADGATYRQRLVGGSVELDGEAVQIHDRAMDAGPSAGLTWLGQVYDNLWAHNLTSGADYPTAKFMLSNETVADHQTCNGSLAPDDSGRLMCLVIPHDYVRIFSYRPQDDDFFETSRFLLPAGMAEWEFPEWSTRPEFFTAVLRASDLVNRLFLVRVAEGELVPEVLEIGGRDGGATYSHLYLEP